jgi:hypothetical protein
MAKKRTAKTFRPQFVSFLIAREYLEKNGMWNPRDKGPPLKGGFQVNIMGTREHYLQLADFLRDFAEKNTSQDGDYHEHFEGLISANGQVRLQIILRKDDVGDCTWSVWFPNSRRASSNKSTFP